MKKNIWQIILLVYVLLIFLHSAMPAGLSSAESGWIAGLFEEGHIPIGEYAVRKSAHFLEYLGMGILLKKSMEDRRFVGYENALVTALFCLAVPFLDETIQLFAAGRSSQVSDIWLDLLGAACGLAVYALVRHVVPKRRRKGPRWR